MIEIATTQLVRYLIAGLTGVPVRGELQESFDDRVAAASAALRDASHTVRELEEEIAARQAAVECLEHQRQVLDVDRAKLEALANLLNAEMRADNRRALRLGLASNALFFILGIVITLVVQ